MLTSDSSPPTVYAIDFGTSNSLCAAANEHRVFEPAPIDPLADDPTILRTVFFFPNADNAFYGAEALKEYVAHGMVGRFIRSVKKHLPSRAFVGTNIDGRPMNLEDLIGAFLGAIRRRANAHFGTDVRRVVLGRPALFSESQADDRFAQYRLERAARLAGFEEIHFCPEPIAAAAHFRSTLEKRRLVLVGDFGGGTSDYTLMHLGPEPFDPGDVLAIGGVSVAGDKLDGSLMRGHVAGCFGANVTYRVPMGSNLLTMPAMLRSRLCSPADLSILRAPEVISFLRDVERWSLGGDDARHMDQLFVLIEDAQGFSLFEAIEQAKRALGEHERTDIVFRYPESNSRAVPAAIDVNEPVTRAQFERGSSRETHAILAALDDTLERAGVSGDDIDIVCLTGGTARVPHIARALESRFGRDKLTRTSALQSVIGGLALRAQAVAQESKHHPAPSAG
ncbi:MAG: Hsp70 family protein [Deltaproteobacteria bacterium]|nr:MAG: Hsp70 family protein [Deltaproteobacteria bacterium]